MYGTNLPADEFKTFLRPIHKYLARHPSTLIVNRFTTAVTSIIYRCSNRSAQSMKRLKMNYVYLNLSNSTVSPNGKTKRIIANRSTNHPIDQNFYLKNALM